MKLYEVNGTYGSGKTPCTVFVAAPHWNVIWYVVKGSINVNRTNSGLYTGVDVEEIFDIDMFTASSPINSLSELEEAINS